MAKPDAEQSKTLEAQCLNAAQQLRLRVSCQYIDKLLVDVESILHATKSKSPFGKYITDVTPAQTRVIEDYIFRIRAQLLRSLAWQQLAPEAPTIPATRAALTNLSFIDIAVEELRPRYMRGSGPVGEQVAGELNGVVHELRSLLRGMERYLRLEASLPLETRFHRLQAMGNDVSLLETISEIVTRHGLVEFRGRIEALTSRLEDPNFEIAFFGRVSSGKSSLLNALLGAEILPVGINPITAVPTRLRAGPAFRAVISYANGQSEAISLAELAQFVTEDGNPGNRRNVTRALAEVPSPRLAPGILLVDTPGLGSLARLGARETLAYLPSADLGMLLVDAGATLSEEDVGTLRLLHDAGIPAVALLSKADLLAAEDLPRAISYIEDHLRQQLGVPIPVHPVSALAQRAHLIDTFYHAVLLPRFEQARTLREQSVARKAALLAVAVIAAIRTVLHDDHAVRGMDSVALEPLQMQLSRVVGMVGEQPRILERDLLMLEESCDSILSRVAEEAVSWFRTSGHVALSSMQISAWMQASVEEQLRDGIGRLRDAADRAVESLREIAASLQTPERPMQEEVDMLFRDLPRFELPPWSGELGISAWRVFGDKIAVSRMRAVLRDRWGAMLKEELHAYGRALNLWSQQITRRLERLLSSYADGYRTQIQRLSGRIDPESVEYASVESGSVGQNGAIDQLRQDLDRLLRIVA